jgi:hypothetical protein
MKSLTSITVKDNVIRDADFPGFAEAAEKGGKSQLQNLDFGRKLLNDLGRHWRRTHNVAALALDGK